MAIYSLKNDSLAIEVNEFGAELTSIIDTASNTQYLWDANPAYWKRHSPILFPIVGSLKDKSFSYHGQTYFLPQHGFARDLQFTMKEQTDTVLWFSLEANAKTKELYPFEFGLELGYRLDGRSITVLWKVTNHGNDTMYFSIGGHPAFLCPLDPEEDQNEYFLAFDTLNPIRYHRINENGLLIKKPVSLLTTDNGLLPINSHMFDFDALIVEEHQCSKVSLLDASHKPYLSVSFDAPVFGIWSPAGKNAPFICIEPWYGRCDAEDFVGTLEERVYGNSLESGQVFQAQYEITTYSI